MDFELARTVSAAIPDQGFVLAIFLLSLRLSAVFLFTPILYAFSVPATARVLIVIGLALGLALGVPSAETRALLAMGNGELVAAGITELALGATLALGILIAFASISMAGRLVDVQIGFGMAQVYDPVTQRQVPVLTSAFDKLGVIVFFLLDGHHALLRGIAYSLERFPLGRGWPIESAAPWVIKQMAGLFALGFALAAPVVVCLLLVELALGVVARNLPQMNMFVIGAPIKIVVGLAALSLWFGGVGPAMNRIYGSIYKTWDAVFAAAPAPAPGAR
ncbi:flagellar biosynthetic protein FliR [Ramlibacter sp. WS9]|uniref:flagellar biosynthetic protein FliR n=1 Tax=Ramlibacter sp. WS9 TaxID=1882741 RepID=UPI001142962E|nr:flagellar biosynthetic protein FliR [Ramlibacter sp. WS9]ROZ63180.1 flagellar biosynthetic protein FliR [Ramlibacter sp. WS9]